MRSHTYNYPSFSSTLLEEIYHSIDSNNDDHVYDGGGCGGGTYAQRYRRNSDNCYAYANTLNKRMKAKSCSSSYKYMEQDNHRNVDKYALDHWMEKDKLSIRRHSMPDDGNFRRPVLSSSSTSSSDSSSGLGGFSSSDTESVYGTTKVRSKVPSLKPIRTAEIPLEPRRKIHSDEKKKSSKKEGKLQLQQRALKLYGDLKKVKQPISPGGKLANFLNSLFHSGGASSKKPKFDSEAKLSASMPSTASSSYARSCLSKTPSSAGRFERRSVKFCPVNVVVDETGQKSTYNDDVSRAEVQMQRSVASDEEFKAHLMEKQRKVEEVAKELLKNYRNNNNNLIRKELRFNVVNNDINSGVRKFVNDKISINNSRSFEEGDENEDDDESCCSSDLFELDNLMEIGMDDRYREELPVYETTHVATNRAIANGYIL